MNLSSTCKGKTTMKFYEITHNGEKYDVSFETSCCTIWLSPMDADGEPLYDEDEYEITHRVSFFIGRLDELAEDEPMVCDTLEITPELNKKLMSLLKRQLKKVYIVWE